jgi:hypothetical protein
LDFPSRHTTITIQHGAVGRGKPRLRQRGKFSLTSSSRDYPGLITALDQLRANAIPFPSTSRSVNRVVRQNVRRLVEGAQEGIGWPAVALLLPASSGLINKKPAAVGCEPICV